MHSKKLCIGCQSATYRVSDRLVMVTRQTVDVCSVPRPGGPGRGKSGPNILWPETASLRGQGEG